MKRLALQLALAATAAFALAVAAPAAACGDDCPMHKAAAADKQAANGEHPCGKDCPMHKAAAPDKDSKKDAKPAEKPAAEKAGVDGKKAEATCGCEKGGKGCTCPKGECKCANCGAPTFAAAEQPKPAADKKCTCVSGKDCGCKKTEKGECSCKHEAPKKAA
jgi:hypothetical protein